MKTESKNILTRENCKAELKRLSKSRLMQDSVVLAVLLLIFVPLFLLSMYLAKYILILGIGFALICAIFPAMFVYRIIQSNPLHPSLMTLSKVSWNFIRASVGMW